MASTSFTRSLNRISFSSLRPHISKAKTASCRTPPTNASIFGSAKAAAAEEAGTSSRRGFRILSRSPVELGSSGGSMYPLHTAVAVARLTSRLSLTSQSFRDLSQGILCRTSPGLVWGALSPQSSWAHAALWQPPGVFLPFLLRFCRCSLFLVASFDCLVGWMAVSRLNDPGFLSVKASRSFLDVVSGSSSSDGFPDLKCTSHRGLPSLWIFEAEILALAAPFQFSLIGKFLARRPSLDSIRKFFFQS
ncbi:hypothetical protein M5K25_026316 [Dendrobium thyrsiflorum]|uniref:Uncharacterized protein n=1 Tax=Dendrobium thyrsiflorum TaxID=117978 RepID=A0ABD0TX93_DENTH